MLAQLTARWYIVMRRQLGRDMEITREQHWQMTHAS